MADRDTGQRILEALRKVREWVEGGSGKRLTVNMPDGSVQDLTIEEYRLWRAQGDSAGVEVIEH